MSSQLTFDLGQDVSVSEKKYHTCAAIDCDRSIPERLLMCAYHWRMVPSSLQKAVWDHYQPIQLITKRPSEDYVSAMLEAVHAVAVAEGKVDDPYGFRVGDRVKPVVGNSSSKSQNFVPFTHCDSDFIVEALEDTVAWGPRVWVHVVKFGVRYPFRPEHLYHCQNQKLQTKCQSLEESNWRKQHS